MFFFKLFYFFYELVNEFILINFFRFFQEYLAVKKYVYRDLAVRNVLLGYNKVVKVCDFGLFRDIYNDNQYYKIISGKLLLKWMVIELLRDRIFIIQSDVWFFGILMWEIIIMGKD